ncbi:MAG: DNA (cytosine-5-)-methyltransferase [Romboutsia sp.]|nr:DNA (cytosine-5-)-methyltransferase [Romboutsia sp.]
METLKVLSLFSGIGAFEKALENLNINYELIGFSEINKHAIESYCAIHNVDKSLNLGDISNVDLSNLSDDLGLVVGGSPCQDFSTSGRQKGSIWTCLDCNEEFNPLFVNYENRNACPKCKSEKLEKTRSSLIIEYLRTVRETKPKYFIYENVKGILGKRFKEGFDLFIEELNEYGYDTYYKVLNSKDFGIPQNRQRVFVIGIRKDLKQDFVFPKEQELKVFLKDFLEEEVEDKYYINSSRTEPLINMLLETESVKLGLNPCDASIKKPKIIDVANCIVARNNSGIQTYQSMGNAILEKNKIIVLGNTNKSNHNATRVLSKEGISCTVMHNNGKVVQILDQKYVDGEYEYRVRKLTPTETFLLMGFEKSDIDKCIKSKVSNTQLYLQAGNSIVVDVLEALMTELIPNEYYK